MPRGVYDRSHLNLHKPSPARVVPKKKTTTIEDLKLGDELHEIAKEIDAHRCPNCHLDMTGDRCDDCGFYVDHLPPTAYDPRAPFFRRVVNNISRKE